MVVRPELATNKRDLRFYRALQRMLDIKDYSRKEEVVEDVKKMMSSLNERYTTMMSQLLTFTSALKTCKLLRDKNDESPVKTINEVVHFSDFMRNRLVDQRICGLFTELCKDLDDYRKILRPLCVNRVKNDPKLRFDLTLWKKVMDPQQDITRVESEHAKPHVLRLSSLECRKLFRGIVSVLPVAINCARNVLKIILKHKLYLKTWKMFTVSDELRKLCEYHDTKLHRMQRVEDNKNASKWRVPDRRLAKVRLDDALTCHRIGPRSMSDAPDRVKTVGTQKGRMENRPKREFGYDRCKEMLDQNNLPIRFLKEYAKERPLSPPTPQPSVVRAARYAPDEIFPERRNVKEVQGKAPEARKSPKPFKLWKEKGAEQGGNTDGPWQQDPDKIPYTKMEAGEVDGLFTNFLRKQKKAGKRDVWRAAPNKYAPVLQTVPLTTVKQK